jgi:hypothetical protein
VVTKWITWGTDNKETDWAGVIWTDEAKMETGDLAGLQRVTQKLGKKTLIECIQCRILNY